MARLKGARVITGPRTARETSLHQDTVGGPVDQGGGAARPRPGAISRNIAVEFSIAAGAKTTMIDVVGGANGAALA